MSEILAYQEIIGNGENNVFLIKHDLGIPHVFVQLIPTRKRGRPPRKAFSSFGWERVDDNSIMIKFVNAPDKGAFLVNVYASVLSI